MVQLKASEFRQRIERYLENEDWDVVCRKRKGAYVLLWADGGEPLARFKPAGFQDEVEVFWWNGARWRPVGEFGSIFRLQEALKFVFDDPEGLFVNYDSSEQEEDDGYDLPLAPSRMAIGYAFSTAIVAGALGGALGGLFSGAGYGLAGGAFCSWLALFLFTWRSCTLKLALIGSAVLGLPAAASGLVGGTLGAALNEALATPWWGRVAGLLLGGLGGMLLFNERLATRVISFPAGVALALWLVKILNISGVPWACILTAVVALGLVEFCWWVGNFRIVSVGRAAAFEWAERKCHKPQAAVPKASIEK